MDAFPFSRTETLLGSAALDRLQHSHVAVVGLGGVGSYAAEALARTGVGRLTLIDRDTVDVTNCNRQLCALSSTVGQYKADVMAARLRDAAPSAEICGLRLFYLPETREELFSRQPDLIVDCVDNVTAKLDMIETAYQRGIPLLCALGTAKKVDPTRLRFCDIYETEGDPLARVMRRELRKRGVPRQRVICSDEPPRIDGATLGSIAWVPGCAGLMLAGEAVRLLTQGV